ncbi:MAG TPA: LamG domain-containing protein, partial [Actinoplanes sp.]
SSDISAGTRWPGPATADKMGDRLVSYGRGSACSPPQAAGTVEFNDNPGETDENLTSTVRKFAEGKWSRLTMMLRANDEGDPNSWKRFKNDATLQVTYFPAPGVPTGVGVQATNDSKSVTCRDSAHAVTVADPTPVVRATVQTAVQPKGSEGKGSLRASFELQAYDATSKKWSRVWSQDKPSSGYAVDGTAQSAPTSTLTDLTRYRLHVQTVSHGSYQGKSQDPRSTFSSWCYFTVNSDAPNEPTIVPAVSSPYTECTANACIPGGGPGVKGGFTFRPDTADRDVTGYRWMLSGAGKPREIAGSTATVPDVTPRLAGTMVLLVEAMDLPNRYGPPKYFAFNVATPAGSVGRWQFGEAGGTSAADTAADGIRHALGLSGGASFDARGRRGDTAGDHALALDGVNGYAATTEPVVNTAASFTVSAWAYLHTTGRAQSVVSQRDSNGNGFGLGYRPGMGWVFGWHQAVAGQPVKAVRSSTGDAALPAKVWTHLAGVYDAADKTIRLFVNGRPQGTPVPVPINLIPTLTTGGLQVGRGGESLAFTDYAVGMLDEVEVWGRALSADEIGTVAQLADNDRRPATALTGAWFAEQGSVTSIPDSSAYGRPPMTLAAGSALGDSALTLDGIAGYAGATGPVVDETGSFTVTTQVKLNAAELAKKPAGYLARVVGQQAAGETSWGIWYRQEAVIAGVPEGRWYFGRTALDASSRVRATESAYSVDVADLDNEPIVQVTGVYNASDDTLRLYIGENEQVPEEGTVPEFPYAQHGSGEMSIGRGRAGGLWVGYLPGEVGEVRIWAGAMTRHQILSQVLDICSVGCDAQ